MLKHHQIMQDLKHIIIIILTRLIHHSKYFPELPSSREIFSSTFSQDFPKMFYHKYIKGVKKIEQVLIKRFEYQTTK